MERFANIVLEFSYFHKMPHLKCQGSDYTSDLCDSFKISKKGIETNLEIYNSIRSLKPNTFSNLWNKLSKASVISNAFLRSSDSNFEHIFPCLAKNLTFRPTLVDYSLSITHPHLLLPTNYAACDILFKIKVKLSLWFVTWQWSYFF